MVLRELLKDADIDFVVDYFADILEENGKKVSIKRLTTKLTKLVEELIALPSIPSEISSIIVVKTADIGVDNQIYYEYEVFCSDNSNEHFSLMGVDVRKIIDVDIYQPSLDRYNIQSVISSILYEITFFGFSMKHIDKKQKEFCDDLEKMYEDYEKMAEETKPFVPNITEKDKSAAKEIQEECQRRNQEEYLALGLKQS